MVVQYGKEKDMKNAIQKMKEAIQNGNTRLAEEIYISLALSNNADYDVMAEAAELLPKIPKINFGAHQRENRKIMHKYKRRGF